MEFRLQELLRENIRNLAAHDEISSEGNIRLHLNENSLGSPLRKWYNRYPQKQAELVKAISTVKGVPVQNIVAGNGSLDCLDALMRACCQPGEDNILICPPTYSGYARLASIHGVDVKEVPLQEGFITDIEKLASAIDGHTKMIIICSPNNPTGHTFHPEDLELILNNYSGIVVVDEAYINFSRQRTVAVLINEYPQLVVLQSFSIAWGLAGLRIGMAFANESVSAVMRSVMPSFNISEPAQELAVEAMKHTDQVNEMIRELVEQRNRLQEQLKTLAAVRKVYDSDANFLMVRFENAATVRLMLAEHGIMVYDCSGLPLCDDCLRITVGTESENNKLVELIRKIKQ